MSRLRNALGLLAALVIVGCVPEVPVGAGKLVKPGTPDVWPSMAKGTRTPLLRRMAPPASLVEIPAEEIEVIAEEPAPPEEVVEEPAPAPADITAALKGMTEIYVVQKGDMLVKIAKRYQVTDGLIRRLNGMGSHDYLIHIGQRIKVVRGPFRLVVDTKKMHLTAYLGPKAIRTYPVGLGTEDTGTPTGHHRILSKEVSPRWDYGAMHAPPGDPNNPVGSRWMKIAPSFGIHGTNDPSSIGKRSSAGCIRMHNHHAEEVYDLVRVGSEVLVQ